HRQAHRRRQAVVAGLHDLAHPADGGRPALVDERPHALGHGAYPRGHPAGRERRAGARTRRPPLKPEHPAAKRVAMTTRQRTIALHCSGAGPGQWNGLAEALGAGHEVLAPEHYGCGSRGPWSGEHAFTLVAEGVEALALIDASDDKVHLVGHSYGGGVALEVALARPDRIASIALYEPSAFHLLPQLGGAAIEGHAEIVAVAQRVSKSIAIGDCRGGIAAFVDYWNGSGAWAAIRPAAQQALVRWAPKVPL